MEFQIGQKVRLKLEFANINYPDELYTIKDISPNGLFLESESGYLTIDNRKVYLVSINVELERLEAAFYEYFDNIYSDPIEKHKLVRESVEELIKVVKSVSINE